MEENRYKAFISYRHLTPDQEIAQKLHTMIETFKIPASVAKETGLKKMGRVFRDQEELPLSADLGGDIDEALKNSEWLIVICSPRLLESKWCMREIDTFIELGKRDHILAVLVEGEPDESFPPQLRTMEKPFVSFIICGFLCITLFEALHFIPGLGWVNAFGTDHIGRQVLLLAAGIAIWCAATLLSYKRACVNFENIDL